MGLLGRLLGRGPSLAEVRAFGRGQRTSLKAAEAYAQLKRDQAATRRAPRNLLEAQRQHRARRR
jgi:hypothetical protein